MNTTLVWVLTMVAVAVLALGGGVWVVLREQRLRTNALQASVDAAERLAQERAAHARTRRERDELTAAVAQVQAQADEAAAALARARAGADEQARAQVHKVVGVIRGALWPMGDPLAPTAPGLAGLLDAGQRTVARVHEYQHYGEAIYRCVAQARARAEHTPADAEGIYAAALAEIAQLCPRHAPAVSR